MSKSIRITLSGISGAANTFYTMTDNLGNTIFTQVYGASLSNGLTYSISPIASSFTITSNTNTIADFIPNLINWIGVTASTLTFPTTMYDTQQITGINQTIILRTNFTAFTGAANLFYKIDDTSPSYAGSPIDNGFMTASSLGTFSVSNNQYITFGAKYALGVQNRTISIENVSDSNTVIDTFPAHTDGSAP